jgi:hypothetical protein
MKLLNEVRNLLLALALQVELYSNDLRWISLAHIRGSLCELGCVI